MNQQKKIDMMKKRIILLSEQIEALEAVCVIHGINDFPAWMEKGRDYLVQNAVMLSKSNEVQVPCKINK